MAKKKAVKKKVAKKKVAKKVEEKAEAQAMVQEQASKKVKRMSHEEAGRMIGRDLNLSEAKYLNKLQKDHPKKVGAFIKFLKS